MLVVDAKGLRAKLCDCCLTTLTYGRHAGVHVNAARTVGAQGHAFMRAELRPTFSKKAGTGVASSFDE
jgi:hypothetical protein